MTNVELYGELSKVSELIQKRRLKLAGHCARHEKEMASQLVLWQPKHGVNKRGRPTKSFVEDLKSDTGLDCFAEIKK